MDGRDFIKVAKSLIQGIEEAEYRSAVSRAYYGAFIFARQLLQSWGFYAEKGAGAHGEVRNRFANCGLSNVEKAANKLRDFHSRRIDADYLRKEDIGKKKTAGFYVKIAEDIVKDFEICTNEPERTKAIKGIKSYDLKTKRSA